MLQQQKEFRFSQHSELYDILIPKDHFLRRFHDEVDFSFIYEELASKYSIKIGRTAYDPILMLKYLILKVITDLSDKDLIEEVKMNLAFKFFLDMLPEEMPIDATTLCKFRTQRIKDADLMSKLLNKTTQMALEKGILNRSHYDGKVHLKIIIDGTHTESFTNIYRPIPTLRKYTHKLRAQIYKYDESYVGKIEKDTNTQTLEAEIAYCNRLVQLVENTGLANYKDVPSFKKVYNRFVELLNDVMDHYSVSVEPDAKIGHKTSDTEIFGYKTQIAMDEDSRLIMGAVTTTGEVNDALPGEDLLRDLASDENLKVEEVLGDTAYSGQPFLNLAKEKGFTMIAPPHPQLGSGIDGRDGFTFNKDADMFCCPAGHLAIRKREVTYKNDNNRDAIIYSFDKEKCQNCKLKASA